MSAKSQKTDKVEEVPEEVSAPEAPSEIEDERRIAMPPSITVKQLADLLETSAIEVIKQLMRNGTMASINQVVDYDTAAIIASDFGYEAVQAQKAISARKAKRDQPFQDADTRLQKASTSSSHYSGVM